jgi:hypothetical protein
MDASIGPGRMSLLSGRFKNGGITHGVTLLALAIRVSTFCQAQKLPSNANITIFYDDNIAMSLFPHNWSV